MHASHILPLVAIPLATSAVIEPRQIEGRVYCSDEIGPNVDNCREAANLINKDSGSYGPIAEFWFGDCQINAVQGAGLTDYIGGQEYFDGVTGIIDACFGHTGSVQLSGLSVTIGLCEVCYGGECAVCNSPGQGPLKKRGDPSSLSEAPTQPGSKRTTTAPPEHQARSVIEAEERGFAPVMAKRAPTCTGIAAISADSCRAAADTLAAGNVIYRLPYTDSIEGCSIAVQQTAPNTGVLGTRLAEVIRAGTDACESGGYIAEVIDTTSGDGYFDVYFGKLCSKFGFGNSGCLP